jgi:hypothetical protein
LRGVLHEPAHPLAWPWPPVIAAMNAAGIAGMLIALVVTYEIAVDRAEREARRANAAAPHFARQGLRIKARKMILARMAPRKYGNR